MLQENLEMYSVQDEKGHFILDLLKITFNNVNKLFMFLKMKFKWTLNIKGNRNVKIRKMCMHN